MPRSITLTFPWFPKELSPNARPNRYAKARATREYRHICRMHTREQTWMRKEWAQIPPLTSPVVASVTFHVTDKRRRDYDNLVAALKPMWDGIVDAGILVDDDYKHLRHAEPKVVLGKEKRVEVRLEEVEG